jgi:hypothetical protein
MVSSWAAAQRLLDKRVDCRSFLRKGSALEYISRLRVCDTGSVLRDDEEEVVASAASGLRFADRCDSRNISKDKLQQLLSPPITAPRLDLLAACLAAETCKPRGLVRTNSDVVVRAYREAFPTKWANQDLIRRLAVASKRGVRFTQIV